MFWLIVQVSVVALFVVGMGVLCFASFLETQ